MTKGKSYPVTLAYNEVADIEAYLLSLDERLENVTQHAEFSASAYGVTIYCTNEDQADRLWELVLAATQDDGSDEWKEDDNSYFGD